MIIFTRRVCVLSALGFAIGMNRTKNTVFFFFLAEQTPTYANNSRELIKLVHDFLCQSLDDQSRITDTLVNGNSFETNLCEDRDVSSLRQGFFPFSIRWCSWNPSILVIDLLTKIIGRKPRWRVWTFFWSFWLIRMFPSVVKRQFAFIRYWTTVRWTGEKRPRIFSRRSIGSFLRSLKATTPNVTRIFCLSWRSSWTKRTISWGWKVISLIFLRVRRSTNFVSIFWRRRRSIGRRLFNNWRNLSPIIIGRCRFDCFKWTWESGGIIAMKWFSLVFTNAIDRSKARKWNSK